MAHNERTNESLIRDLEREGYLKTPRIIDAFRKIDRKDFVLPEYISEAYENYPLPIGLGQTISQPLTVAFMLEQLSPQPGDTILEIGAGSGWKTALLSYIVTNGGTEISKHGIRKGTVISFERLDALADMATRNISKYDFIENGVAKIIVGDGAKGYLGGAPYSRIVSAATARTAIPVAWKEQLKVHGRIVAPLDHVIEVIDKITQNDFNIREYPGFSFVPLVTSDIG